MVTVPADTPVTTPPLDTAAIVASLLDQTPPGVTSVIVIVAPSQTLVEPMIVATVGNGFTITITVVVDVQLPTVAVIVNVVVCCVVVVLVNVPAIDEPVPLAPIPVRFVVFVLVQLKIVPGTPLGFVILI
jgi:hypothetical protein